MTNIRRPKKSGDRNRKNKSSDSNGTQLDKAAENVLSGVDCNQHDDAKSHEQSINIVVDKEAQAGQSNKEAASKEQSLSKESSTNHQGTEKNLKIGNKKKEENLTTNSAESKVEPQISSNVDEGEKQLKQVKPIKTGRGLAFFAVILSLSGAGGAGYIGWQTMQFNEGIAKKVAAIGEQGQQLPQQFSNINSQISQLSSEISRDISTVDERSKQAMDQSESTVSRFDLLVERVNEVNSQDRTIWLTAESEYLMRLANQRLLMAEDTESAKALLTQAEKLLVEIDEYGLFQVRQILAKDIAALSAVSKPEIESLWLQLNALGQRVYNLSIVSTEKEFNPAKDVIDEVASASSEGALEDDTSGILQFANLESWKNKIIHSLESAWFSFSSQFRVRSDRTDFNPELLVPGEEQNLRHNLHLMVEQAQLALIKGQPEIYRESLNNILAWIDRWFINKGPEAEAIITQVQSLKSANITVELPEISQSLKALQQYRKQHAKNKLMVPPEKGSAKLKSQSASVNTPFSTFSIVQHCLLKGAQTNKVLNQKYKDAQIMETVV